MTLCTVDICLLLSLLQWHGRYILWFNSIYHNSIFIGSHVVQNVHHNSYDLIFVLSVWQEAYGGWISVAIWLLVLHSAQREVRERHHYSVDCVAAIYVGILLWRMTGFIWSARDLTRARRLAKLEEIQSRLVHAAKDSDIDEIRGLLKEVELAGQEKQGFSQRAILTFAAGTIIFTLSCVLIAFTMTSDGWFGFCWMPLDLNVSHIFLGFTVVL